VQTILKARWLTDSVWIKWLHKYQSHGELIMTEELKMTERQRVHVKRLLLDYMHVPVAPI
jgi:hypothetical protein